MTGNVYPDRAGAETELRALLEAHPAGVDDPLWYDPKGRQTPTFQPPLSFGGFLLAAGVCLLWPVLAIPAGVIQLAWRVWCRITTSSDAPPPETSAGWRVFMITISVMVIALSVQYVFKQDFRTYFVFQTTTGKVLETKTESLGFDYFEPKVRFSYTVDGQSVDRWTHPGWHVTGFTPLSQAEAEAILTSYPVGSEVLVWYDPDYPPVGILKRYARPHLWPILIPPVWLLVVQTRKLLRRE
jgi:hypothetical protein